MRFKGRAVVVDLIEEDAIAVVCAVPECQHVEA
jgi:hypothetical protein